MNRKTKKILTILVTIAALSSIFAYYQYNKPHVNVADATAVETESATLHKAYTADSIAAKKKFTDQIVAVTGTASRVSKNQQGQFVLMLKTDAEGAFINCTMDEPAVDIKEGSSVTIKGICSGIGQGDADLGILGDVYLVRCYLRK